VVEKKASFWTPVHLRHVKSPSLFILLLLLFSIILILRDDGASIKYLILRIGVNSDAFAQNFPFLSSEKDRRFR
jgi:hypothetical protein